MVISAAYVKSQIVQAESLCLTLKPDVYAIIIAWAVTFTIIATVLLTLGFGPVGVGAGMWSLAQPFTENAH
jgi:hypothetical protein